jgi:hypothetical protein
MAGQVKGASFSHIYNPTEVIVSLLLLVSPSFPIISNRPPFFFSSSHLDRLVFYFKIKEDGRRRRKTRENRHFFFKFSPLIYHNTQKNA